MEDMLLETEKVVAQALGNLLCDHKGIDVLTLDLREMSPSAWTDFFVIATASSDAHMDGLERHIKEFCREREIEIFRKSRKPDNQQDEWRIIDLGGTVIHLMSQKAREFYELERLYSDAELLESRLDFKSYYSCGGV